VKRSSIVDPAPRNITGIAKSIARAAAGAKSGAATRSAESEARRRAEVAAATASASVECLLPVRGPQTSATFSKIWKGQRSNQLAGSTQAAYVAEAEHSRINIVISF
jgi:hypothetical protein